MLPMLLRTAGIAAFCVLASAQSWPASPITITCDAVSPTPIPISQCNTGNAQCCNTVMSVQDPISNSLLELLWIGVVDKSGGAALVGTGCTPITVIGLGSGANCAQQPVCCEHNEFNGLISICCTPMSL